MRPDLCRVDHPLSGTTPKTVKRVIARHESSGVAPARRPQERNYDTVTELVAERVEKSKGRIRAKRLLPAARAVGYEGFARNFRRLVAERKALLRPCARGRALRGAQRAAMPAPAEIPVGLPDASQTNNPRSAALQCGGTRPIRAWACRRAS